MQSAAKAALLHRDPRSCSAKPGSDGGLHADALPRSYRVLGVTLSATAKDIAHAYRKLAAKWHPDKWATAAEEQQKVGALQRVERAPAAQF
jgi:DnaJ-class molecular chaperone